MAASSSSSCSLFLTPLNPHLHHRRHKQLLVFRSLASRRRIVIGGASRKSPNYPHNDNTVAVVPDPRPWVRDFTHLKEEDQEEEAEEEDQEEEEEEEEEDRSLDLLARFLHNLFKKISRRARKQARSILPQSIPTKLVGFSVNGVLVLGFLWILKSFLEVVCTVGSMVFVSILLVRGIWSGISYIKEQQYYNYITRMDNRNTTWSGSQPAAS